MVGEQPPRKTLAVPPVKSACTSCFSCTMQRREPLCADTADAGLGGESFSGFLPTLFDDDLDAFQFDDIFQGGSEADLDNFFANIFSAPSFPRGSPHEAITAIPSLDEELVTQYRSHAEILSGYYRLIHPVFPILPPPLEDGSASPTDSHLEEDIQLAASSPLMLALHALLILIPDPGSDETFSEDERQSRASVSQTLFQRALEALELTSQTQITGLWVHYIRAEEALVAATLLLVALLRGFASESEVSAFNRDIGILDRVILHQLGSIGSHGTSGSDLLDSPEARLAVCLRTTSRARLMSARIKLHRYRAFMGHPRILKRFAAVTPMQSSERDSAIDTRRGEEFSGRAAQMFPFSSEHSHRVCLESATAIAHGFDRLRSLGIRATPTACSSNLAGFTLMMISHFQTSMPGAAGSEVTRQEVQRLCKEGVDAAIGALGQFSGHFGFVKALKA
ncbi:c6 zinc finger domain-containing protein [Colletotrichum tabaci]|uniref:C6 zinc finger domain-containing protein n=1 Tax=Colletotrichum tabaci TaxID=1209068 RepID=A0AAV9SVS3_9PEZI